MADPKPIPAHHNTQLPPAIKRQAERAEQLQREAIGAPPAGGETPPAATPPEGSAEPVQPPPGQEAPSPPPAAQAPPAPAPAPPSPAPTPADQLAATQGRLDAERERNQQKDGEIASLRRMVGELQQQMRQPPPASDLPKPPKGKLVTPEEEADYGAELLGVMGKRARDEVAGEIDGLKNEINELKAILGNVGQRVEARDTNDVFTQLHQHVPNWLNQNADPNFIHWLQLPEPFSGLKRHDLLLRAFDSHDADRVIRFFQGYLAEAAATGQSPAPTAPSPANPANGKVPLATYAAPGRAAPAPASAPPGTKPTYTRAEISKFFTEKSAGRWRGRESEAAAMEADIFRAGPEGRVIG